MRVDYQELLQLAKKAAAQASEKILEVYGSEDFEVEVKGDNSPLTRADKLSHQIIVSHLEKSGLPILSEEGKHIPYPERSEWEYFWMVDPIDGTKEFIKRNGEFTVNIALIHDQTPVLGVVQVPVTGDVYWAFSGGGAFKNGESIFVNRCDIEDSGIRVVASRSHMNDETKAYIENLNDPEILSKGSSLKLLLVAEGEADLYPRFAPTMEWDTAAAHIVVSEAGGSVKVKDELIELIYNKENLLNPHFLVSGEIIH